MPKRGRDDAVDDQTEYTPTTLSMHDGECDNRIFLALKGKVYEVTERRDLYGMGGTYHFLAGKDATRALAKMTFDQSNVDNPRKLDDLNEMEQTCLGEWEAKFQGKYEQVGVLVYPDEAEKRKQEAAKAEAARDEFYKSSGGSLLDRAKAFVAKPVSAKPVTSKGNSKIDPDVDTKENDVNKENTKSPTSPRDDKKSPTNLFDFIDKRQQEEAEAREHTFLGEMGVEQVLPDRVGREVSYPAEDDFTDMAFKETCEMGVQCGDDNVQGYAFRGYSKPKLI